MINLHTGLPGSGKTLFTLWHIDREHAKRLKEREETLKQGGFTPEPNVYYHGINQLNRPGWIPLDDPETWHTLPPGSIVLIDEAQKVFRPRSSSQRPPEFVSALETHRHTGIDLYLITQHPMLVDSHIRRLSGTHRHIVRIFGAEVSTIHTFLEVRDNVDKSRKGSQQETWTYPKEVYNWYKSAEVHTHKFRLPKKVLLLAALVVLIPLFLWLGFRQLNGLWGKPDKAETVAPVQSSASFFQEPRLKVSNDADWLAQYRPRVAGLAHTAPRYDEVTKPVRAPYPAGCVQSDTVCRCYSDQGTVLDVPKPTCVSIVNRGFYVDWDTNGGGQGEGEAQASTSQPAEDMPGRNLIASDQKNYAGYNYGGHYSGR